MHPRLSPDGKRMAFVVPGPGRGSILYIADFDGGHSRAVARSDGDPMLMTGCDWSGPERLVCEESGVVAVPVFRSQWANFQRLVSVDTDGTHLQTLGQQQSEYQFYPRPFDGEIIDWMSGTGDSVLMSRVYTPEKTTGRHVAQTETGLGVDLVDTRTLKITRVEAPRDRAGRYISDGQGNVRLMTLVRIDNDGQDTGERTYYYRRKGAHDWQELGKASVAGSGLAGGFIPLAVDSSRDVAYVLQKQDGRKALYSILLDGSLERRLVLARPDVDVDGVVTAGRNGHVIGATWTDEYEHVEYFDPDYRKLAAALAKAIPDAPLVGFASASADEQVVLIRASSDRDPGHYYLFDRRSHQLDQVAAARPWLEGVPLAIQKPVEYPAADGTRIPAYLTLPPGITEPKGLPALVIPHGGPAHRDDWGFDWLAQYFAHRGYAVLQPNFRGSTGYGDAWFVDNGFKSWKLAVGDVDDGGRWLVAQGIADPTHLAILGWSYGGYAALQSAVLSPGLFKAVVAIAPVTDFALIKEEMRAYADSDLTLEYIGSGPHIVEGSPRRHPEAFQAPVLMFHGEMDMNVSIRESRAMDEALRTAGKSSELVVYKKLDHALADGAVRADLLRRADAFLSASMGPPREP